MNVAAAKPRKQGRFRLLEALLLAALPAAFTALLVRQKVDASFSSLLEAPEVSAFKQCVAADWSRTDAHGSIYSVFVESKKRELINYLRLARERLEALRIRPLSAEARNGEAREILESMRFEKNGYYYLYDAVTLELLAHPFRRDRIGETFQKDGTIVPLADCAKRYPQGGFLLYSWDNPAEKQSEPKLGIVGVLSGGWMLGTGIYLNDYETERNEMGVVLSRTKNTATGLTFLGAFAVILLSLLASVLSRRANYEREIRAACLHLERRERARVARELHDGLLQILCSAHAHLRSFDPGSALHDAAPVPAPSGGKFKKADPIPHELYEGALSSSRSAIEEAARETRRIALDLAPSQLENLGLSKATEKLACDFQQIHGIRASVTRTGACDNLKLDAQFACYRVVQEALHNTAKHSRARQVEIRLEREARRLSLSITDDGQGFHPEALGMEAGMGLASMRERVALAGGAFEIRSRPGCTTVVAQFPLGKPSLLGSIHALRLR